MWSYEIMTQTFSEELELSSPRLSSHSRRLQPPRLLQAPGTASIGRDDADLLNVSNMTNSVGVKFSGLA